MIARLTTAALLFAMTIGFLVSTPRAGDTEAKKDVPKAPVAHADNKPIAKEAKNGIAFYFKASDGTRIACDLWFPADYDRKAEKPKKLATIMRMTRYLREIHILDSAKQMAKQNPKVAQMIKKAKRDKGFAEHYTSNEFAYLSVDARGTGASFGSRHHPWTKREILDYGEIVDWVAKQDWSNGRVGAIGVSYEGQTAEFIAANAHPALKVIVPQFDEFDVYHHVSHPGGVFNDWFVKQWNETNKMLDSNNLTAFAAKMGFPVQFVAMLTTGAKPVDGKDGVKLRDAAVKEHKANADVYKLAKKAQFRDEVMTKNRSSLNHLSPWSRKADIERSDVVIYGWASWLDAGTAEGALARYMTYKNTQAAVIGPWKHGGGANSSPIKSKKKDPLTGQQQYAAKIRFLKAFLQGSDEEIAKRRKAFKNQITYYVMGAGDWRNADTWPPKSHIEAAPKTATNGLEFWQFNKDKAMGVVTASDKSVSTKLAYKVDYRANTGTNNRWHTQIGQAVNYQDRRVADRKLLTFTSAPLTKAVEIIGSPEVELKMSVDQEDAAVFVYLEMFDPKTGASSYIAEGMLRLMHRKESDASKAPFYQFGTYHSFKQADALKVEKDKEMNFRVRMFPTAVQIPAGMAIRIAIGGADSKTFARYPASGDTNFSVSVGTALDSGVHLPIRYLDAKKAEAKKKEPAKKD